LACAKNQGKKSGKNDGKKSEIQHKKFGFGYDDFTGAQRKVTAF
jgi:hypothetical protein